MYDHEFSTTAGKSLGIKRKPLSKEDETKPLHIRILVETLSGHTYTTTGLRKIEGVHIQENA